MKALLYVAIGMVCILLVVNVAVISVAAWIYCNNYKLVQVEVPQVQEVASEPEFVTSTGFGTVYCKNTSITAHYKGDSIEYYTMQTADGRTVSIAPEHYMEVMTKVIADRKLNGDLTSLHVAFVYTMDKSSGEQTVVLIYAPSN